MFCFSPLILKADKIHNVSLVLGVDHGIVQSYEFVHVEQAVSPVEASGLF